MPLKSRYKRRIIWSIVSILGTLLLSFIVVPPMINLNSLKPQIETMISKQTGLNAKIEGNVNFSLLRSANIVAHNIKLDNGNIDSCEFIVPISSIFDIKNTKISGDLSIYGAQISISKLSSLNIKNTIHIHDSNIKFLNKTYTVVRATISGQDFSGLVRTDQHKYEITSQDNMFIVSNKNNQLKITGQIFPDGTADGVINITAENINKWFEFDTPKIEGTFPITTNFKWNGSYGIEFSNIMANNTTGNIKLNEDGSRIINLQSNNIDFDFSFLLEPSNIYFNTSFDLNLYGNLKFADQNFKHVSIKVNGFKDKIIIDTIQTDQFVFKGGVIDKNGAHDVHITLPFDNKLATCNFSGNSEHWECLDINYNNKIFGNMYITNHTFDMDITSKQIMPDIKHIVSKVKKLGTSGKVKFLFSDAGGILTIKDGDVSDVSYDFLKNKNLEWLGKDLYFLPKYMKQETGDFVWKDNTMYFLPYSKTWQINITGNTFWLSGDNIKKWFPNVDLQSLKNLKYTISGNCTNNNISDLTINIADHIFTGSATENNITLSTNELKIDNFINKKFFDNFEENSFFAQAPITLPYYLNKNIALSTNALVLKNKTYKNFIYSLKPNIQTFSITDDKKGNILATLYKDKTDYNLNIQLNRFMFEGYLLPKQMPLNISNPTITAEIKLQTYGKIAHDIYTNLTGAFDLSFENGTINGLGLADFYASAKNITTLNVEYILSKALESGNTPIKKMRIIGTYNNGDIKTTAPITLSMKHVDAVGNIDITNKQMNTKLNLTLRGTSSGPAPIELTINPKGVRNYSLSEIMLTFDPEFMRTFISSHDKF
ncbi:MAG: hypothetical protein MJ156_00545 [Alphaproteobacteria bacterium]|nr:hypothetical protein [Alphaproteobacteria bacterium]